MFLFITVKLDFDIDRKSASFDFKNLQNISVDQITFSFYYIIIIFYGTQQILITDMALYSFVEPDTAYPQAMQILFENEHVAR